MSSLDDAGTADNRSAPGVRALLFDLDGVLWDSNALHEEAVARTCAEAGLSMPDYARLAGLSTPEAFAVVLAENGEQDASTASELSARKRSLFQDRIDEVPSDHEALQRALEHMPAVRRALVTGASRATTDAYLHRLPAGFFEVVITGEDGLPSKPAPDVYLSAASRLGVDPGECVVFEDSDAGLEAARRAGMRVAHVTGSWGGECDGLSCNSHWCATTVFDALEAIWGAQ